MFVGLIRVCDFHSISFSQDMRRMEEYLQNYDGYTKKIVYNFYVGAGGLGDCVKFFIAAIALGMKHKCKVYYQRNQTLVEKYVRLKYPKMYIEKEDVNNICKIDSEQSIQNVGDDAYIVINPSLFYTTFRYKDIHTLSDIFVFTDEIVNHSKTLFDITDPYISVHLRMGDAHLETDPRYVNYRADVRARDEEELYRFIEHNKEKKILFMCDNNTYKLQLKENYPNIYITNCAIGHTGFANTTDDQARDTIAEFYLLTQSEHIYCASYSGFPIVASKFHNIPITFAKCIPEDHII